MQAMTQMMERMNFVMGNVCDRLDRVEKRGNEDEPKANSGNRAKRCESRDHVFTQPTYKDINSRKSK
jgi:hypothetical protein